MKEKYLIYYAPGQAMALWRDIDGNVYIGGKYVLGQAAIDIAAAAFDRVAQPEAWRATSQRNKYRLRFLCTRNEFQEGIKKIREKLMFVVDGPLKSIGRVAI